jgi:pyridoxal phosphate enzyme (YggS family)
MGVKDNILTIQQEISSLCATIGRKPSEITLLAVIKEAKIAQVKEAIDAGIADIGENKVQDALINYTRLNTQYAIPNTLKWHMIGHLQANKVKDAVKIFDLIHSVDSLHLAQELNKQAEKINKIQDILIEVNISGENTIFGLKPD